DSKIPCANLILAGMPYKRISSWAMGLNVAMYSSTDVIGLAILVLISPLLVLVSVLVSLGMTTRSVFVFLGSFLLAASFFEPQLKTTKANNISATLFMFLFN